jgi:large subunit ribosomal protein L16
MGRGKGNVDHWVSIIKPGKILFEVVSKEPLTVKDALEFATRKLPFNSQVIARTIKL